MRLTIKQIDNAKPRDKKYKMADGRGLCLLVSPSGAKLWVWRYRIGGAEKNMAFGEYPWPSIFERPIYFVELRDGYACSWCELKEKELFLVPFPQSRSQVRQVRIPFEAEVVGRVTAISMRIAEV